MATMCVYDNHVFDFCVHGNHVFELYVNGNHVCPWQPGVTMIITCNSLFIVI